MGVYFKSYLTRTQEQILPIYQLLGNIGKCYTLDLANCPDPEDCNCDIPGCTESNCIVQTDILSIGMTAICKDLYIVETLGGKSIIGDSDLNIYMNDGTIKNILDIIPKVTGVDPVFDDKGNMLNSMQDLVNNNADTLMTIYPSEKDIVISVGKTRNTPQNTYTIKTESETALINDILIEAKG